MTETEIAKIRDDAAIDVHRTLGAPAFASTCPSLPFCVFAALRLCVEFRRAPTPMHGHSDDAAARMRPSQRRPGGGVALSLVHRRVGPLAHASADGRGTRHQRSRLLGRNPDVWIPVLESTGVARDDGEHVRVYHFLLQLPPD